MFENALAFGRWDMNPVTTGHLLLIPFRHVASYFEVTRGERDALWDLVAVGRERLDLEYRPDGYNIGINVGQLSGQTVFHLHIHLIPRYRGDMENPRGGVRGVIPSKQSY